MKIFIDFDDVVFNSKKFIDDYSKLFEKYKISEKNFKRYYYDYPQRYKKLRQYESEKHLQRIAEELNIPTGNLQRDIRKFIENTQGYVFGDLKYLEYFKKRNLYLISYSKTNFQETKIKNSGIGKHFKKTIVTNLSKAKVIKKIIKNGSKEAIYFLDNRIEHIENVKKNIPQAVTILMRRKEDRYKDKKTKLCDFEAKNLKEACQIIKQKCQ